MLADGVVNIHPLEYWSVRAFQSAKRLFPVTHGIVEPPHPVVVRIPLPPQILADAGIPDDYDAEAVGRRVAGLEY